MKKFHIHVGVKDLQPAIGFYSALFGEKPLKEKPDYAKWEPKDTSIIFAISTRSQKTGVDHMGIRVDSAEELNALSERLKKADLGVYDEGEVTCCYAKSNKAWVKDPTGIPWEAYQNMEDAQIFNASTEATSESACCAPAPAVTASCCPPSESKNAEPKKKGACC